MRLALPLLLLAGCAGWEEPTAEKVQWLALQEHLPSYVRGRATVDVESPWFSGRFTAAVAARTGDDPAVRLQLLPDLGGKAVDVFVSPRRLRGRFPHTGEEIDWVLPGQAKPHPLLFLGLTLLEEFAAAAPRVTGWREEREAGQIVGLSPVAYRVRGLVPPMTVEIVLRPSGRTDPAWTKEWRLGWRGGEWARTRQGVEAPRSSVRVHESTLVEATSDLESLLK